MSSSPRVTRRGALRVVGCAGAVLCAHAVGCAPGTSADAGVPDGETSRTFAVPARDAAPVLDSDARVALVRIDERVYAHSALCTHEQCVVRFDDEDGVFDCPCHGARFSTEGLVLEPPATRALDRHPVTLTDDGRVEVDLTVRLRATDAGYDDAFVTVPA